MKTRPTETSSAIGRTRGVGLPGATATVAVAVMLATSGTYAGNDSHLSTLHRTKAQRRSLGEHLPTQYAHELPAPVRCLLNAGKRILTHYEGQQSFVLALGPHGVELREAKRPERRTLDPSLPHPGDQKTKVESPHSVLRQAMKDVNDLVADKEVWEGFLGHQPETVTVTSESGQALQIDVSSPETGYRYVFGDVAAHAKLVILYAQRGNSVEGQAVTLTSDYVAASRAKIVEGFLTFERQITSEGRDPTRELRATHEVLPGSHGDLFLVGGETFAVTLNKDNAVATATYVPPLLQGTKSPLVRTDAPMVTEFSPKLANELAKPFVHQTSPWDVERMSRAPGLRQFTVHFPVAGRNGELVEHMPMTPFAVHRANSWSMFPQADAKGPTPQHVKSALIRAYTAFATMNNASPALSKNLEVFDHFIGALQRSGF